MQETNDIRMLSLSEACRYCGMGRNGLLDLAKSCGAAKKYGARTLFDKTLLDKALDDLPVVDGKPTK